MSHFDLKNRDTDGTKMWPKFLGQNDSFFFALSPREKMSHFDLKNWNTGGTKMWPKFLGQNDSFFCFVTERKNESFWPKKIESLEELQFDPNL